MKKLSTIIIVICLTMVLTACTGAGQSNSASSSSSEALAASSASKEATANAASASSMATSGLAANADPAATLGSANAATQTGQQRTGEMGKLPDGWVDVGFMTTSYVRTSTGDGASGADQWWVMGDDAPDFEIPFELTATFTQYDPQEGAQVKIYLCNQRVSDAPGYDSNKDAIYKYELL